ncbi:low molecular weight protein-tyrosine-phosphatase [Nocardioides sp. LHG3406-4]|uniref:low molecular weight protein-tyrosine-phosphatase n=1 Tax=Nocardioides sp. LHG3406-4 TaxID=2804575 RepID=UPI003CF202C6
MPDVPEPLPRSAAASGPYRIALVCLGNICRSPMAHVVLESKLREAGLAGTVEVASSGTGDWHVGRPMDTRAAAALTGGGYDGSAHRARQFDATWLDHDLVLVMDEANLADVRALGGSADRVRLFREFDPVDPGSDVPDPYYGGEDGFREVLTMVERTSAALVAALRAARVGSGS